MDMIDLFSLSFEALTERKVRAILTIAMVIIGAALITGLNGLTNGLNESTLSQFKTLGANVVIVFPGGGRMGGGTALKITDYLVSVFRKVNGVREAVPFIQQSATVQSGSASKTAFVIGVDQQKLPLIFPTIAIEKGAFISSHDTVSVVLGNMLAYPPGEQKFSEYGRGVTIKYTLLQEEKTTTEKRAFRVGGVLAYMGSSGMFIPVDRMAIISLPAANSFFDRSGNYDGVFIAALSESHVDGIIDALKKITAGNAQIFSAKSVIQMIQNIMGYIQMVMGSIATVSLIVAAVGIFTALYTSVTERTREIGVLKAIGFKKWMILGAFLNEAILIGIVGGSLGVLAGIGLAQVLAVVTGSMRAGITTPMGPGMPGYVPPIFTPQMLIFVWVFCCILSVLAGIYPAWRAARLDPVVALRKE